MSQKVQMWGNSLAVRIPKAIAENINIEAGTSVDFSLSGGSLVLTPNTKPKYSLEQLLNGITDDNLHGETSTGVAVGKEIVE